MRLHEILKEDVSLDSSLRTITDILTTEIPELYRTLYKMAENYYHNNGELGNGFKFVSGSQKAKWMNTVFFKNFKPSLYYLYKKTNSPELKNFLNKTENPSFNSIESELYTALEKIAKQKNFKLLQAGVNAAENAMISYFDKLNKLDLQDSPEDDEVLLDKPPKEQNIIARQNQNVEAIINDVLGRIDRKHAGEIRQILARTDNKLQTLQAELTRRRINPR